MFCHFDQRRAAAVMFLAILFSTAPTHAAEPLAGQRPNIIFILTDDQGYGDLSCHGNPILKTPHLDRLHHEGVRFFDFHVSPTCSPTRSVLMTGRHEFKNGVTHTINERERLALSAITLPSVLQSSGYATGIFGKWHLGDEAAYQPQRRGFTETFIHGAGGIGQSYPGSCGDAPGNTYFNPALLHNGQFEKTTGYCTDLFFQNALHWIDGQRQQASPFFCYIATNAPHEPLQVRPEDEAIYANQVADPKTAKFFGMIHNIDDNVGRLLKQLDDWNLTQKTLIVFMNDNGGTNGVKVFNAGMRGQKVTPWLGGTRASSLWRWPGHLEPHDVSALAAHLDFFPTVAELAGVEPTAAVKAQVEGRSLVPLLHDAAAPWPERTLVTHVGRWPKGAIEENKHTDCSVRRGPWHLVWEKKSAGQLFDVATDPGEKTNVAAQHPDVMQALNTAYDEWWTSIQPLLVNEAAPLAASNPFRDLYYQQFPAEQKSP